MLILIMSDDIVPFRLHPYNMTTEQPIPACGKRLGIPYVRASCDTLSVLLADSFLELQQEKA